MSDAIKSGMRGMERPDAKANPADRGTDPGGNMREHVKQDADGENHLDVTSLVAHLEQGGGSEPQSKEDAFKKPNADKEKLGGSTDSKKDSEGNENG